MIRGTNQRVIVVRQVGTALVRASARCVGDREATFPVRPPSQSPHLPRPPEREYRSAARTWWDITTRSLSVCSLPAPIGGRGSGPSRMSVPAARSPARH